LAYLGIYFIPWAFEKPSAQSVLAGLLGCVVFLLVYVDAYFSARRTTLPHVAVMALIGFALSPFGGAWSVFNVFASSLASRSPSQKTAIITLVVLQAALAVFGVAVNAPWPVWASGLFFGSMSGFGVIVTTDLERRNRLLLEAQGEVRRLAASAERERIAQDLHDLLGHTLTLVAVKADLAARLTERYVKSARREMEEVATAARDALSEVRAAVKGMQGASLTLEAERARKMLAAANVDARISLDAAAIDPRREAVLAMALREAVTNVIRHAGAASCAIEVDLAPDGAMRLTVTDDGRGGGILEGAGLSGMRARLSAAGGVLDVRSGAGGTVIAARLPEFAA
jgi:two-component system sensor histidine kinase DesK